MPCMTVLVRTYNVLSTAELPDWLIVPLHNAISSYIIMIKIKLLMITLHIVFS